VAACGHSSPVLRGRKVTPEQQAILNAGVIITQVLNDLADSLEPLHLTGPETIQLIRELARDALRSDTQAHMVEKFGHLVRDS